MEAVTYDEAFFETEARVASESAWVVLPWVFDKLGWNSCKAVDVGCGTGAWLEPMLEWGSDCLGIDLYAPNPHNIMRLYADISSGIDCTGWDLAICLEVAEHLPEESAEPLVAGLAKAGTVLFSAATPGQIGVGHIHCQPHDYWHDLFATFGMTAEFIGDQFTEPVADFYRRNMYLYRRTQ